MSADANKGVVLGFFENFSAGKFDDALAMMRDDATWWVAGKFELSGTKTKAEFGQLVKGIGSAMPNGLKITPKSLVAEGNNVAVEAEFVRRTRQRQGVQQPVSLPGRVGGRQDHRGARIPRHHARQRDSGRPDRSLARGGRSCRPDSERLEEIRRRVHALLGAGSLRPAARYCAPPRAGGGVSNPLDHVRPLCR